jgi:hypothetical protein
MKPVYKSCALKNSKSDRPWKILLLEFFGNEE